MPQTHKKVNPYLYQTGSKLDFSHLEAKGVGYVRHRNLPKEVIECVPYQRR